jgi:hypothetical protein
MLSLQAADLLRTVEFSALACDIESSKRALAAVQELRAMLRAYLQ